MNTLTARKLLSKSEVKEAIIKSNWDLNREELKKEKPRGMIYLAVSAQLNTTSTALLRSCSFLWFSDFVFVWSGRPDLSFRRGRADVLHQRSKRRAFPPERWDDATFLKPSCASAYVMWCVMFLAALDAKHRHNWVSYLRRTADHFTNLLLDQVNKPSHTNLYAPRVLESGQ